LVYNPGESTFLRKAKENGAVIKNGYDMLVFQAEKAWKIWKQKINFGNFEREKSSTTPKTIEIS
jgi:shikimate 5-dehydrogenase